MDFYICFERMLYTGVLRIVCKGISNRIQINYFGGAISGQKGATSKPPFWRGQFELLPALAH